MKKLTSILVGLTISSTSFASTTIVSGHDSRNSARGDSLKLNAAGSACIRTTEANNKLRVKPTVQTVETSEACKYLQAAAEIEKKIGRCEEGYFTKSLVQNENGVIQEREVLLVSGKHGVDLGNRDSLAPVVVEQSCLCGKMTTKKYSFGLGSLNVLETLFNGPYHKDTVELKGVTSIECTQFFRTDYEKQVVRAAYRKFGLK